MTKVALIGTGPCGLSFLRSLYQAKKKGENIPEVVAFDKQSDWVGFGITVGEQDLMNTVILFLIVCTGIYGQMVQRSA